MKTISTANRAEGFGLPQLEPLEVHSGLVLGRRRSPAPPVEAHPEGERVRDVLEALFLPALSAPPCRVAFSGGLDSSAILATATDVARRHGLDDPVPLTLRYDQHPRTWETEWQELVVGHLALRQWEVVSVTTEFDVLGSVAREALLRHGLYWPTNSHAAVGLMKAARDGTLITGEGGDEVFSSLVKPKKMSPAQLVRSVPLHRALMTGLVALLPQPWRVRVQFSHGLRFPWLRPAARREVRRRFVVQYIGRTSDTRHYLETLNDSRYLELTLGIATALADDYGVRLIEPFLNPRLFRAALSEAPTEGFPRRATAIEWFFADLLPPEILRRTSKAVFTESFWGPESLDFARGWDGTGLDTTLIDPDALLRHWSLPKPDFRSATPLQAAWLASLDSN